MGQSKGRKAEFEETVAEKSPERMEEEMGDLLFSVINVARLYKNQSPKTPLKKRTKNSLPVSIISKSELMKWEKNSAT